ncbi:pilus assembly protein [Stutzerimonas tarimensis]|uniref:Pilus assembly protein n=1 Tax=Stutzerimonas tarimensis TaxID=1507735 RepID=A0ABV7T7S0_9GAMM
MDIRHSKGVGTAAASLVGFALTAFISSTVLAVDVAQVPLFLSAQVKPNVIMAVDDSGSMDSEILLPGNDGAAWWRTDSSVSRRGFVGWGTDASYTADSWVGGAQLNFNNGGQANSTWKKYTYLFPNGTTTSSGGRVYSDSTHDHYAVPPVGTLAYFRSAEYNKAYFDYRETYLPWPSVGGKSFTDMSAAAAKYDPWLNGSGSMSLTTVAELTGGNELFRLFQGMVLPRGTRIRVGSNWHELSSDQTVPFNIGSGSNRVTVSDNTSYAVSYFPATLFCKEYCPSDSWGYSAAPVVDGFSPGATVADMKRYEIKRDNFNSQAAYDRAIQNFANWFSYYRKRQLATRGGIAAAFKDITTIRAASFRINNRTKDLVMRDFGTASEKEQFFTDVMAPTGSGGTPNRQALLHAGEQLMRTDGSAPIQYACQANATILFTDGYSDTGSLQPEPGNADGNKGAPYADTASNTIADIAMKYYTGPLRSGIGFPAGRVPVPFACNTTSPPPWVDCNRNLHMLTYGVTLGSKGILYDPENPVDPYESPPAWWTSFTDRNPRTVDDLWHATINGRGQMLNANTPAAVASTIRGALDSIVVRTGSSSAVATNSTRLDTDTFVFQAKFDSSDWSGSLLAYLVGKTGEIESLKWSSDDGIPAAALRNIITWNGSQGVSFTEENWSHLSVAQRDALRNGGTEAEGKARLQWLRGVDSAEERRGGALRNRQKKLGDIVNSDPLFVFSEDYGFSSVAPATGEGAGYLPFLAAKATRTPMVYVGANDGMLHGFDANTGHEKFAFIPSGVFGSPASPKLAALTSPTYSHQYFVDGSPRVSDAYVGGAWRSVLIGSTGAGGQSVFALDVTDPGAFSASKVMWENQVSGTAVGSPVIVRLASGDWAAIYGNGYGANERVKLMIVKLSDGSLIKSIDTGKSGAQNGLATPLPVDVDNDRITDYVYVGDLEGNMWKFDLTDTNPNQWGVSFKSGNTPVPLFAAGRPITARAIAGRGPDGEGVMIYFGTGRFIFTGDNLVGSTPPLERFYGIHDTNKTNSRISSHSALVKQTVTQEGILLGFGGYRVTSQTPVDYRNKSGWYLDLQSPGASNGAGERVVSQALLRAGRVIFTTFTPSSDPCSYGGTSWLMELDAINGQGFPYSVFDVNGDGLINESDFVELAGESRAVGGKSFDEIIKTPGVIGAGELEYKYTSGSSGSLEMTLEKGSGDSVGRQSWRQLQ